MKIVFSSDFHLGLKTDETDRTEEIINVMLDVVKHCAKLQEVDNDVILVLGGDIFNTNTPSENLISQFLTVLNLIRRYDVETYILVGNHDAIADSKRLSCLSFIKRISGAYSSIKLIEDIKYMKMGTFDTGPLHFTFLPHITKALINNKVTSGKLKKEIPTQEYINNKCGKILEKVGKDAQHIVFSHLNVRNMHGGSEESLLRKSEVYLPNVFINTPLGYSEPIIVQGHHHSKTKDGNVHIVGSPIFCSFGEAETDKYFLEIDYSGNIGEEPKLKYIRTKCINFKQIDVDMISDDTSFFERKDVDKFLDLIAEKNTVAKFNVVISPQNNTYNWKDIREQIISETDAKVKEILPRVILKRKAKSEAQVASLNPDKAIKVYLVRNMQDDKNRMKQIYIRSRKYTQGALNAN